MKNILKLLVLVLAFTVSTQAQKKGGKPSVDKMLAQITKELNLTSEQQSKIKPLLMAQMEDRLQMMQKNKAMKESGEKPSKEARKKMREERMQKEADMDAKMKNILTSDQYEKFQENAKARKEKGQRKKKEQ